MNQHQLVKNGIIATWFDYENCIQFEYENIHYFPKYRRQSFVLCDLEYSSNLLPHLVSKCPNLQALYASCAQIKLEQLQLFNKSLKFFFCPKLHFEPSDDHIAQITNSFQQLETFFFDAPDNFEVHASLKTEAIDPNCKVLTTGLLCDGTPIQHLLNFSNNILMQMSEISCISSLLLKDIYNEEICIPGNTSTNLRCLRINNNSLTLSVNKLTVEAPLMNLEYLELCFCKLYDGLSSMNLFASRKLKDLHLFYLKIYRSSVYHLLSNFDSYEQLYDVLFNNVHYYKKDENKSSNLQVALPKNIKRIKLFSLGIPIEVTNPHSVSLRLFGLDELYLIQSDISLSTGLEIVIKEKFDKTLVNIFIENIQKFVNLEWMSFLFWRKPLAPHIQLVLDSFRELKNLTLLDFTCDPHAVNFQEQDTGPLVLIDPSKFPSVKKFSWFTPLKVRMVLSEPFEQSQYLTSGIGVFVDKTAIYQFSIAELITLDPLPEQV